jgi:hypothetical protein
MYLLLAQNHIQSSNIPNSNHAKCMYTLSVRQHKYNLHIWHTDDAALPLLCDVWHARATHPNVKCADR